MRNIIFLMNLREKENQNIPRTGILFQYSPKLSIPVFLKTICRYLGLISVTNTHQFFKTNKMFKNSPISQILRF